ncbi:MAG: large conductance mechanosensitive channel protein MscL [Oscillospiraceae bacterium]|nr:large conductance mechanosensitive channel protein MscL [Oscillospiraceae bacterium]
MKKLAKEFKDFIMRGNVLDLAVGVIMATAFGAITTSLINDLLMPFIAWLFGAQDMSALNVTIRPEVLNEAGEVTQEAIVLGIGTFVSAIINFLLIALVIFVIVKSFNKAKELAEAKLKKAEEAEAEAPAEPEPSAEEKLLTEIRDILKEKQ